MFIIDTIEFYCCHIVQNLVPQKKKILSHMIYLKCGHQMSLSTNKSLVKSFVEEVFNNHNISATEKYFTKENPPIGSEGFKQSLSVQFKAFPDIQAKIEYIVAEMTL
jgi:predicted ester cyclase